jgi:hypothetical protein
MTVPISVDPTKLDHKTLKLVTPYLESDRRTVLPIAVIRALEPFEGKEALKAGDAIY